MQLAVSQRSMTRRKPRRIGCVAEQERPSCSVSPELGFQSESSCEPGDAASVKPAVTSKKRGARINTNTTTNETNIIAYLEEKISDTFETAYNSISEASGSKYSSEILLAAFNKIEEENAAGEQSLKSIFFEKLQHRLSYMVESLVSLDKRRRVLRFIAKFSINQWKRGVPDFVHCLVEYCESLSCCDDVAVRQNICTLVGFLLKEQDGGSATEESVMSIDIKRKLYSILLERQLDKVTAVRSEVILSVADIQDDEIPNDFVEALERSPRDVILMGFRDVAADCRLVAVCALHVVVPSHADYLIELASCDPNSKVRVAAIRHLSRLPLTFLTEHQRMELLRGVIFTDEPSVMDAAFSVLIPGWLSFIHRAQKRRNEGRDSGEHTAGGELAADIKQEQDSADDRITLSGMRQKNCDHGLGAAAQGLLGMIDFCDSHEADVLARATLFFAFDVIRHKLHLNHCSLTHFVSSLVNDNTFPEVLSTHNYMNLLDSSLSKTDQAQYAFFWRVLIEYCCERAESECERLECIHMLAPPLSSMCDLIIELEHSSKKDSVNSDETESSVPTCDIHQIAILHLLSILRYLDHRDAVEMGEWKCLLLHFLRDVTISKELTECVIDNLVKEFFDGKPEQLLVTVCDAIAETIRSAGLDKCDESSAREMQQVVLPHQNTMRVCMQLTHSMLRTGVFQRCGPLLKKLFDDIIVVGLKSENSRVYVWALEAAGILAMLEESLAEDVFSKAEEGLKSDSEELQISAIEVLTDLLGVYGYDKIVRWQRSGVEGEEATQHSAHFASFILNIITSKDIGPSLCLKSCECAAKILLLQSLSDEVFSCTQFITGLICRLFHSSSFRHPEVRLCIEKFFAIFSAVQRKNQLAIMAAFHLLMSQVRNASDDDFVLHIDIVAALNLIVWCHSVQASEGMLLTESKVLCNQHFCENCFAIKKIMLMMYVRHYIGRQQQPLDLEEFEAAELLEAQEPVQIILAEASSTSSLRSKVVGDIHKFMRSIENAFHVIAGRDAETSVFQDAERGDCITELRSRGPLAKRGRRRTPRSSHTTPIKSARTTSSRKKASTSIKRSTQKVLEGDGTPSPPAVVDSLVTPIARSRPLLTRSAKLAAASKTRRWLFEKEDE
uniref:Cnd3 domain-containing protein n=1 Tax=Haemonchus contortus TaxID=6289 RepID=A0A7I4YVB2_HAECO